MRNLFVPLMLLGWPLAEIAGFVIVGKAVGLWITLALVIGTAVFGLSLIRGQGMQILRQMSAEGRQGRMPASSLVDRAMIVVAGILLMLPGFLSDIVGIALIIPPVRKMIWALIGRRVVVVQSGRGASYTYRSDEPGQQRPGHTPAGTAGTAGSAGPSTASGSPSVVDLDDSEFHRNGGSSAPNPSSPWVNHQDGDKDDGIDRK
ncbi:MAG: FxsA family protein [Neorhizobium sp.]|nr:FxsA family protein [Neorhizobium sp.]